MHDVFVSYPRRDRARVQPLVGALQELGLTCFFDLAEIDSGDQFPDVIDAAVKNAACVLGVWSPHALSREWVRNECRIGLRRRVLVTARIEEIDPGLIPTEFGAPHITDLSTFRGEVCHMGFIEIVSAIADKARKRALHELAQTALGRERTTTTIEDRIRTNDERAVRSAWDDLKSSTNVERIVKFREEYARGTLLEYMIEERLEAIGSELVATGEAAYPSLTRVQMLRNLRDPAYWRPQRYHMNGTYALAVAPAYDRYSSSAADAYKIYLKAAGLNNAIAMGYVAIMLQEGTGVAKDTFEAGRWCTRALALVGH